MPMSLESNMRALAHNPLLSMLDTDARKLLAFSSENVTYRQGDIVFKQGDKSDAGYFILNGSMELRRDQNGHKSSEIAGQYFLIGEMAMISETIRPVTAFAREKVEAIKISRLVFHKVLREFPESALQVRTLIQNRIGHMLDALDKSFSL
jgi:CRP-like cAMP-binding protein